MTSTAGPIAADPLAHALPRRALRILLQPRAEWAVIDAEPQTVAGLYVGYIAPLAAIPPLATLVGVSVFGVRLPFGGTYRVPIASAATSAVVQYVLGLAGIFVLALIIDALAPTFGGERNRLQALKVAAYSATASWIAGIVGLVPALGILAVFGVYSLYLIYLGLPAVMHAPRDRALGYAAASVASAIALFFVAGAIASRFIAYPSLSLPVR